MDTTNQTPMQRATEAFAEPGSHCIIDIIHPDTGLSFHLGENLDQVRARYPKAERVNVREWCAAKAARQDAPVAWNPITKARYWDALECLPPVVMRGGAFLIGEEADHHAVTGAPRFTACYSRGASYFESSRPLTVAEFNKHFPKADIQPAA